MQHRLLSRWAVVYQIRTLCVTRPAWFRRIVICCETLAELQGISFHTAKKSVTLTTSLSVFDVFSQTDFSSSIVKVLSVL